MGDLLRRYWTAGGLVARARGGRRAGARDGFWARISSPFATRDGKVGLLDEHCAHRGASLYFGKNADGGLRCWYHGWKYDVDGNCLDQPNEPPQTQFKRQGQAHGLSLHRAERRGLDLYGPARQEAAAAGARMADGARKPCLRLEALSAMPLDAGHGRRHRFDCHLGFLHGIEAMKKATEHDMAASSAMRRRRHLSETRDRA